MPVANMTAAITTLCGRLNPGDGVTTVALESDCEDCRAKVFVGPMNQTGCAVRTPPSYKPEPWPQAELILRDVAARREGAK